MPGVIPLFGSLEGHGGRTFRCIFFWPFIRGTERVSEVLDVAGVYMREGQACSQAYRLEVMAPTLATVCGAVCIIGSGGGHVSRPRPNIFFSVCLLSIYNGEKSK